MDDWQQFWQGRVVRIVLYMISAGFCGYYGVSALLEMITPNESSQVLVDSLGMTGFYAVTGLRVLVCAWACFSFVRMALKTYKEDE